MSSLAPGEYASGFGYTANTCYYSQFIVGYGLFMGLYFPLDSCFSSRLLKYDLFPFLRFPFCKQFIFLTFDNYKDRPQVCTKAWRNARNSGVTPEHAPARLGRTPYGRLEVPGPWFGNPLSSPSFLCTSSSVVTSASVGGGGAGWEALLCSHVDVCCLRGWQCCVWRGTQCEREGCRLACLRVRWGKAATSLRKRV